MLQTLPADPMARSHVGIRRGYLDAVVRPALARATEASPPVCRSFALAGQLVRFEFHGAVLAERLTPALVHNETSNDSPPDLTISLWDSAGAGLPPPLAGLGAADVYDPVRGAGTAEPGLQAAFVSGEDSLSLYDDDARHGYCWMGDQRNIPGWVVAAPVRTLLQWFFSRRQVHLVHGAAVAVDGRAVLITAKGGSGKSTTALSSVASGLGYLSDDYTAVSLAGEITAHSFYNSAKLTPSSLAAFPEFQPYVRETSVGDGGKSILYVAQAAPAQIVLQAPLVAMLIPVLHKAETTHVVPASKKQAFLALAPSTMFQLPLAGATVGAALRELVDRVPCHFLMLGPDVREVPGGIERFLRSTAP